MARLIPVRLVRSRLCRHVPLALVLFALSNTLLNTPGAAEVVAEPGKTCSLKPGPKRTVVRVADGETLVLDDGSEVRLAGSLAPRSGDANARAGSWPAEQKAIDVLSELVIGQTIELAYGETSRDRYGRHIAHAFLGPSNDRIWIQGRLLSQGLTRAYAIPGGPGCLAELLTYERVARLRHTGLWRNRLYRIRSAGQTGFLSSLRSTFQIVRGRVTAMSRTRSGLYLNFGSNWREDFTVRVPPSLYSRDKTAADKISRLEGRDIEVRGWLERNNGPMIVITDLAQIVTRDAGNDAGQEAVDNKAPGSPEAQDAGPEADYSKQERPEQVPGALDL